MEIPAFLARDAPNRASIQDVLQRRTDLSTFVVHLTRDTDEGSARENFSSIIRSRVLRAGAPRGWATWERFALSDDDLETQRVVCFSETPLEHVHAMFADIEGRSIHFKPYGIALPKMVARWLEINPVWYVDLSLVPGAWRDFPTKEALNALVLEAADDFANSSISRLAPFIEGMGGFPNGNGGVRLREFSWEREWRRQGDVDLGRWWSKVLWLCPAAEHLEFQALIGDGARCIDPGWGLERIIGHLLKLEEQDMTPFGAR